MHGLTEALLITSLFFIAGIMKGFFGIGIPPVILGVLTFFYDPRQVVILMLIPIVASNARQAFIGISPLVILQKHIWLLPVSTVVIFGTVYVSGNLPTNVLLTLTGVAMILFSVTSLIGRVPPVSEHWKVPMQIISGALSGLLGGVSGIWGPPLMIYLLASRLANAELIQTIGVFFFFLSGFMTLGIAASGEMTVGGTFLSFLLIMPVIFGMKLGERFRGLLNDAVFIQWFLVVFLLLGFNLLRRGIWS
ncbi:MAG: sulfite exporter TauE/SafE family protein [Pseudomonadota bacterium]